VRPTPSPSVWDQSKFAHLQCGIDPRTSGRMDCDVNGANSAPDESAKESSYFHVHGSHLLVSLAWSFPSPCFGWLCSHVAVALAWLLHHFPSSNSLDYPLSSLWTILPIDIKSPVRSDDVCVMLDWASVHWAFVFFISSSLLFVAFSMWCTLSNPAPQGGVPYREPLKHVWPMTATRTFFASASYCSSIIVIMRSCFFFKSSFWFWGPWSMDYLCNNTDFDTGLLLSQSLSFKVHKMYIAAIYFKIVQKYTMSI